MTAKTSPIPEGFHSITPDLIVRDAADAIDFYKRAFCAVERYRMQSPDGKSIVHAELVIGNSVMFLCDESATCNTKSPETLKGTTSSLHLYVEDVDAVFARAVQEGATVAMPLENMFWGDRFGAILDPFGHRWSLATHVEDLSSEEIERRGAEFMAAQAVTA